MNMFDKSTLRIFGASFIMKGLRSFDRRTTVVVTTCWLAAFVAVLVAVYSLWLSGTARRDVAAAEAMEPILPRIVKKAPSRAEMEPLMARLQKRFGDLGFSLGNDQSLMITGVDGNRFRSWLTSLSYIDTISPQYRWSIKEFCVGARCGGREALMRAVLVAEKISFTVEDTGR